MKGYILLAASGLVLSSGNAFADLPMLKDSRIYLAVEGGSSSVKLNSGGYNIAGNWFNEGSDKDDEAILAAKVGIDLGTIRFDLAYRNYQDLNHTTLGVYNSYQYHSTTELQTFMLTAYYDIPVTELFAFYVGLGCGVADIDTDVTDFVVAGSESSTSFAWQMELGAEYSFTTRLSAYGGLRYVDLGENDVTLDYSNGNYEADYSSAEVFAGLRLTF